MLLNGGWGGVSASLNDASCNDGGRKRRPRNRWHLCGRLASYGTGFNGAQAGSGGFYLMPVAIYFDPLLTWDLRDVDRECKAAL